MKQCPRCHKKFNNDIKFCPVCGYKDDNINSYSTNIKDKDFKTCPKCNKQHPYLIDHCTECGYSTQAYKNRMKKLQEDIEKPIVKNIPRCPICQSTNLSKITTTKKATKIGLFGILGAGDISKTWKCNNCGSKF